MGDELKTARILFIIGAILTFLGALVFLALGIFTLTIELGGVGPIGGLAVAGGVFLGIAGGLKIWCANLANREEKLTTAGVLGIIFGVIPGDLLSLIAGILVLVKKDEIKNSSGSKKKSKKKSKK